MSMRRVIGYRMRSTVSEFEEGRRIVWHPNPANAWRYNLTPTSGGTLVVEQWEPSGALGWILSSLLGFRHCNRRDMEASLTRLAALARD